MDNLQSVPGTFAATKAGLAAGTTTTTTTANTSNYCIKGKAYTAAGAANAATPTTDSNTGAAFVPVGLNKASVFVIGLDVNGALKAVQGSIVDYNDDGTFVKGIAPQFPAIPDGFCPIGYELVKVSSTGSAWTFGSSNQAAQTGITKVFVDLMTMPDRPQVL